jgi:hypothetical protein
LPIAAPVSGLKGGACIELAVGLDYLTDCVRV